jgi:hypothetical protein
MARHFTISEGGRSRTFTLNGRQAWCLGLLIEAGPRGISAAELPPGVRLSAYIEKLRRLHGIAIGTEYQDARGTFGGRFARHVLRSDVREREGAI